MNKETEVESAIAEFKHYFAVEYHDEMGDWLRLKFKETITTHDAQLWERMESLKLFRGHQPDGSNNIDEKSYNKGITDAQKLVRTEV